MCSRFGPTSSSSLTPACTQVAFRGVWTGVDEEQKRRQRQEPGCSSAPDRSHAPRGNAAPDAPRPVTRSVTTSATTRSAGAIIVCHAEIAQTPQGATLEGRAQGLRRGQRGMDAALAAPGHGWPMAACPRSNAEAREPDEGGPDTGANGLVTLPRQSNAP